MESKVILHTVHGNKKYPITKSDKNQYFNMKKFSSEHLQLNTIIALFCSMFSLCNEYIDFVQNESGNEIWV